MLSFNGNLFRLALLTASTEETRYYLNGVYVEPYPGGGVTLTSTDGHRMICIFDAAGKADECAIINLRDGLKHCKPKPREQRTVVVQTGSNSATILVEGALFSEPIAIVGDQVRVDGFFPDWRRIVPHAFADKGAPIFAGDYLADFGRIAFELATHQGGKPSRASAYSHGPIRVLPSAKEPECSPALIRFPQTDFAFGVLMPCGSRQPNATMDAPAWFRAAATPVAQVSE